MPTPVLQDVPINKSSIMLVSDKDSLQVKQLYVRDVDVAPCAQLVQYRARGVGMNFRAGRLKQPWIVP